MTNVIAQIATKLPKQTFPQALHDAGEKLRLLIDEKAYVGEVVSLGYNDAILQIHDFHRQQLAASQRCASCLPPVSIRKRLLIRQRRTHP